MNIDMDLEIDDTVETVDGTGRVCAINADWVRLTIDKDGNRYSYLYNTSGCTKPITVRPLGKKVMDVVHWLFG